MKSLVVLLLMAQLCLAQNWVPIGAGLSKAKLNENFGRKYALRISAERLNYDSTGLGDWRAVNPIVRQFDSPVFGYNYGVRCGEYWALFPDSSDGAVAFAVKKGHHALTMHLTAAIYYSHDRDSVWILSQTGQVAGEKQGKRITYPAVITGIDWTFEYQNERLKTGIVLKQAARDILPNPGGKGWSDEETWMGFALELKVYSFTDTGIVQMPNISWGKVTNVPFSYLGELLYFLPVDIAYLYSNPSIQTDLHRRFKQFAGKEYLIIGLPYLTLQATPEGIVVFDPSPMIIGAGDIDDAQIYLTSPTLNYGGRIAFTVGRLASTYRAMLRGDLSAIESGSAISVAKCSLYCSSFANVHGDPTLEVSIVDSDWVEGTADGAYEYGSCSWNNRGHGTGVGATTIAEADSAWASAGGDYSSPDDTVTITASSAWYVWEIENILQAALDSDSYYGMFFKHTNEGLGISKAEFTSTESETVSQRPRIYIEYEAPEGRSPPIYGDGSRAGVSAWAVQRWGNGCWGR